MMDNNLLQELEFYINNKVDQLVKSKTVNSIRIQHLHNDIKDNLEDEINKTRDWLENAKSDKLTFNEIENEGYLRGLLFIQYLLAAYNVEVEKDDN